jgi:hypothetical protein
MKALICFILGVVVGVAAHAYLAPSPNRTTVAGAREGTTDARQTVKEAFDPATIKDELAKTGKVIREKARQAGEVISDATANARATASIKTRLVEDKGLSAFKIDVDTTDGVVTLSGTVGSYEEIDRAIKLALETEGVYKVVSTLQVKAK